MILLWTLSTSWKQGKKVWWEMKRSFGAGMRAEWMSYELCSWTAIYWPSSLRNLNLLHGVSWKSELSTNSVRGVNSPCLTVWDWSLNASAVWRVLASVQSKLAGQIYNIGSQSCLKTNNLYPRVSMKNTTQQTETLTASKDFFFQNFYVVQRLEEAGSKIIGNVRIWEEGKSAVVSSREEK